MKDNPQIDSYLYLFVVYLTAMPVVPILSLTQENASDLRSVGTLSLLCAYCCLTYFSCRIAG
jgi:hypothetical protein